MLKYENATWEVTSRRFRMQRRGLSEEMLKIGAVIQAEGYPSTRRDHEMRAERITVDWQESMRCAEAAVKPMRDSLPSEH